MVGQPGGDADGRGARRLVVAAVLVDDLARPARVLAARRSRPAHLAGRWELPGGKVEPGETPEQALHRELAEELAVTVVRGPELRAPDPAGWPLTPGLVMRTWWCALLGGEPRPGEAHDAVRWADRDALPHLDWLEPDRPVLARVLAALSPAAP